MSDQKRKLAVIVFTDIVGFTKLWGDQKVSLRHTHFALPAQVAAASRRHARSGDQIGKRFDLPVREPQGKPYRDAHQRQRDEEQREIEAQLQRTCTLGQFLIGSGNLCATPGKSEKKFDFSSEKITTFL